MPLDNKNNLNSDLKTFEETVPWNQRLGLAHSGGLGNAITNFNNQQNRVREARRAKREGIKQQLFEAVTTNYRESPGEQIDKDAYSGAVEKLYGPDSIQFQTLFNKTQVPGNVPPAELEGLGGGPDFSRTADAFDPVLNIKKPKAGKIKAQSRNIIETATGNIVGQGFFTPSTGQTTFQDGSPLKKGQIGIAGVLKGGKAAFKSTNKEKIDLRKLEIITERMKAETVNIEKIMGEGGFAGNSGAVIRTMANIEPFANNIMSLFRQKDKTTGKMEVNRFFPTLAKQGVLTQRMKNSVLAFAKMVAASEGDTGKALSDKDLELVLKRVGDVSSTEQLMASMKEEVNRAVEKLNITREVLTGIPRKQPKSKPAKVVDTDMDELAEESLKRMGL